jgi:oxygen-independent coproporphyrinogen-3 oxidase
MIGAEPLTSSEKASAALLENLRLGYSAYTYAYPHKSAYRSFAKPVPLEQVWQRESREDLFLYVHVPFCHYRCGFCNLFALGAPKQALVSDFLTSLSRQIKVTAQALGRHRITRMAIGGGTPSYLDVAQFETLMECLHRHFNIEAAGRSFGIEVAPDSASAVRLRSYRSAGVTRISMGVQSVVDQEMDALARPRQRDAVLEAVRCIRELDFDMLNLDLIYGIEGQTEESFTSTLESVLALGPDELYLYPLYVRQLTGLAKAKRTRGLQHRSELYRVGTDRLREGGFTQISMRMFRRGGRPFREEFACQTIGTVGLGVGARSYTHDLHYSEEFAVSRGASQAIVQAYNQRDEDEFSTARFGFALDESERCRRYLLQSLLMWPGVDLEAYQLQFGRSLTDDFPALESLTALSLARRDERYFALTETGMANADAIGPWLYSDAVRERMGAYDWR